MLQANTDSLYGRITQRFFGLGAIVAVLLLVGVIFNLHLTSGRWLVPAVVAIPLVAFWMFGFELRRLLAAPEQILTQLSAISTSNSGEKSLAPVTLPEPAAAGWNQLLESLNNGGLNPNLERRLAKVLQSDGAGDLGDVVHSLSDGVAVSNVHGDLTFANRSFRALLNLPDSDEKPANVFTAFRELYPEDSLPDRIAQASAARYRTEVFKSDIAADGVLNVTCSPLEDASTDSFVWTIRDITQSKLAETMRNQFVETATHELRTPLANIKAYAETLELTDEIPVEQQKEFVNIINSEATRLSRFVDELLNLSQMDAGSLTISRSETHFDRLLQECIEHARPQIDKKQQTLETQIPAKLPSLNIDKDKVAACLVNLLGNASKYSPEEAVVRIAIEQTSSEICIRVEDSGYGISEEELPRVFNRFFRSNDERVREEPGSGLGLAYTEEVARLHGGRLTVESELDKGSQFTLHLPL